MYMREIVYLCECMCIYSTFQIFNHLTLCTAIFETTKVYALLFSLLAIWCDHNRNIKKFQNGIMVQV